VVPVYLVITLLQISLKCASEKNLKIVQYLATMWTKVCSVHFGDTLWKNAIWTLLLLALLNILTVAMSPESHLDFSNAYNNYSQMNCFPLIIHQNRCQRETPLESLQWARL